MNDFIYYCMEAAKKYVEFGAFVVFAAGLVVLTLLARDHFKQQRLTDED